MKAIGFYKPLSIADEQALTDIELPMPELRPRDILVKVEAVSVNPVDTKVRNSATPPEGTARVLGFDASAVPTTAARTRAGRTPSSYRWTTAAPCPAESCRT